MPARTLTENQRSLIRICFEIGRDRFNEHARSTMPQRACDQFARQAKETEELMTIFDDAGEIIILEHVDAG